jgi:GWxTD domain-containing protein
LSLIPIASETEGHTIRSMVKLHILDKMQNFLYDFWLSRYNLNAESKFIEYRNRVNFVNKEFSTATKRGYESDRGFVYLKYGIPYSRLERHDNPKAFPYEIWHYYTLPDNQKDIRFVFYTRVETSNDYELVHSTARGELANQGWKTILLRGDTPSITESQYDQNRNKINTSSIWGSSLEDDYNMPR